MEAMFSGATSFDQNIGGMGRQFRGTATQEMFYNAASFNRPLNDWSLNQVTNTMAMFAEATSFNQDLSDCGLSASPMPRTCSGARRRSTKIWGGAFLPTPVLGVCSEYEMLQS